MEENKKDVTIYDIAEELNISPSTVSRALNDHSSIGSKTKKAVKKLAEKWGYRPNSFAASLRTKRSNTFGIIVSWINRPFISSLISGIENTAREAGFHTIITQTQDYTESEITNVKTLYDNRISALIVSLAMETTDYSHFDSIRNSGIPIVFVDRIPPTLGIHKVQINNFSAAFEATEHLIEQGCKRIMYFGGARHQSIYEDRRLGYVAALKKHDLELDKSLMVQGNTLDAEEGYRIASEVLSRDSIPDGIFCANDTAAVSAIQCAKSMGILIPDQLKIIGFNDDPICTIIDPPLSSVHHPAVEMGEAAVRKALAMLENEIDPEAGSTVTLDTHIVVRKSTQSEKTLESDVSIADQSMG